MSRLRHMRRPGLWQSLTLSSIIVAAALMLPIMAHGQEAGRIHVDQILVGGEDLSQLTALVSVSDATGRPISGLTEFETLIDGVAVTPISIATTVDEDSGVAVLLLVDVSGSMAGAPIDQAQRAATTFVGGLQDNDRAAIVPFGSNLPEEATFLPKEDLVAAVGGLRADEASQGTALYASIVSVLDASWETPLSRRALVLLTDGQDSGQVQAGRELALAAARARGLPIYSIALGENADVSLLESLSASSGGVAYFAPEPNDILAMFEAIGTTLRSQYVVTMPLPDSDNANRELSVSTEVSGSVLSTRTLFVTTEIEETLPNGTPIISMGAGALGVLILIAVLVWVVRSRGPSKQSPIPVGGDVSIRLRGTDPARQNIDQGGRLIVLEGPNSGAEVEVGNGAIVIGSGSGSGLRLDGSDGSVASTHARVWIKGGQLMLHHVARRRETLVGERAVEWATLRPLDTLRIGPHLISFSVSATP